MDDNDRQAMASLALSMAMLSRALLQMPRRPQTDAHVPQGNEYQFAQFCKEAESAAAEAMRRLSGE